MDRKAINTELAKALAYKQCGKHAEAECHMIRLIRLLDGADLLSVAAKARISGEL